MQLEERQNRIEEHLQKVEFASLEELSELVDASVSTVRRDVTLLEARGTLRRTHGGARLVNPKSDEFAFTARDTHQLDEKEAIAQACADLIPPNQTVIIDAGTTCFHVARRIEAKTPHIITNSLPVANLFAGNSQLEVVVSGGVIYPRLGVLVGPLAVEAFTKIHADVAIMSCGGVTPEGVTNSHALLIEIQRAMIQASRRVILCVDHTKFGRQSISRLCNLSALGTIITDQLPPREIYDSIEQTGIELIVTGADSNPVLPGRKMDNSAAASDVRAAEAAAERDRFID